MKLNMQLTGADVKNTQDGSRQYMKAQFTGKLEDGRTLKASININPTSENAELLETLINGEFHTDVEIDENAIKAQEFAGEMRYFVFNNKTTKGILNEKDVKNAMGIKPTPIAEALKAKLRKN